MTKSKSQQQFLNELQHQANLQAPLNTVRWLPKQIDPITSLIGKYPWQTLLILSGITTLIVRIFLK